MNKYELMFIISADANDEEKEAIIEKVKAAISQNGTIEGVDKMGMKKFAYPINFKTEGYYVVVNFAADPSIIAAIDHNMTLNEKIVRQMFIKKEA